MTQIASGALLGPYQIVSRIGAGGMGEVWRARDTRLERDVAIKVLPHEFRENDHLRLRFEREARTISQLNHPHICTLHDVGDNYLVMELLEGETLAERVTRGPLTVSEVVRYGAQIAEALDRAHRAGVVHRDLKPANVMLTRSGAKLLDFGLATAGLPVIDLDGATQHRPLTAEGTILGTFQYMSPEQLEGSGLDGRSDIFALGVLLYEMATGRRAFEGSTKTSLIAAIVRGEPRPLRELQPLTPPALEHVIRKCLEKSPEDRWQSAHDIAAELRWISESGSSAGVAAPLVMKKLHRERAAWAALMVVVAGAAGLIAWNQKRVDQPAMALSIVPPENVSFEFSPPTSGSLTISPDGRHVTFPGMSAAGRPALYLRSLDSLEARELPGTDGEELFPFWSPDSRFIAFFAGGKLKKIDLAGSPPVVICDAAKGRSGDWNRDDTIIFSPDSVLPVHKVPASGGKPVPVTALDPKLQETTHRWATFLPDGQHFIYMAGTHISGKTAEGNAVYLTSLEGGTPQLLLRARSNVVYSAGYLLFVRDHALLAQPFDPAKRKLSGDPFPIAPRVQYAAAFFRGVFAASSNGTVVYRSGAGDAGMQLAWLDRAGNPVGTVGVRGEILDAAVSPDGSRVAISIEDDSGMGDLWIHDLARDVATRLTFGTGSEYGAVWSPDGKSIAYSDERRGVNEDIYIKRVGGGAVEEVLIASDVPNDNYAPTSWSPDGRYILSTHTSSTRPTEIVVIPVSGGGKPEPYIPAPARFARFSPDGKWVAYASSESGRLEVYLTSFPRTGGKWQVTSGGVNGFRWVGKEIFYFTPDRKIHAVEVDTSGGEPVIGMPRALFTAPLALGGDISPDGQRILAILLQQEPKNSAISVVTNWR